MKKEDQMKNHLIFGSILIAMFSGFIFNIKGAEAIFVDQETVSKDKTIKSNEFYEEGTKQLILGHYEKAISLFLNAVEEDNCDVNSWDNLGVCYRRTGQNDKAIQAYITSIKINPYNIVPYTNLGLIHIDLKDYEHAQLFYNVAVELDKDNPEGYYGLGFVNQNMGLYDDAIKNYLIAAELYSKNKSPFLADTYCALGFNYASQHPPNNALAVKYYQKAKNLGHQLSPDIDSFLKRVSKR
jgi:tetratricopeptide (TPR) repeat protein